MDGADGLTPPDGTPSTKPGSPVSWSAAIDSVVDKLTRRALRAGVALMMLKLQLAGKMTPELLVGRSICAVGVEAALRGLRENVGSGKSEVPVPETLRSLTSV